VEGNPDKTNFNYVRSASVNRLSGPQGLPITKPPYGRITAIDLGTGEHVWMAPHGDGPRQKVIDLGLPDPGPLGDSGTGPVLTRSLLFVAQADGKRNVLRAFDKATGATRAEIDLPLAPAGTPMTYMSGDRQFIVIASGMGDDARLVALALPAGTDDQKLALQARSR
jgi:quinoprotein glucose dehydrogenase